MAVIQRESEDKIFEVLQVVERFIFLIFRVTQRPSNTKNNDFYRLAHSYYHQEDETTIETVIETVESMTQGEEGEGDDYKYIGWFNWDKFVQNMDELFKRDKGFYKWNGIRYFLYEYELDLQKKAGGEIKISWPEFISRRREDSIEHIYPQTPTDKEWVQAFKGTNKKQKKTLTNSLGNLLLLSRLKNSELQNKPFSTKKRYTNSRGDEVGYFNGSFSEIQVAQRDSWTPHEILRHGEMMINFLGRRWGVDFEGWEHKKYDPLFLSFLNEDQK